MLDSPSMQRHTIYVPIYSGIPTTVQFPLILSDVLRAVGWTFELIQATKEVVAPIYSKLTTSITYAHQLLLTVSILFI